MYYKGMNCGDFADYVANLGTFKSRLALSIRPFIKTERLTYEELQERVYQTAHFLASKGVGSGDRIMVIATNSPEWMELFLGTQLIGALLVTVDAASSLATVLRFIEETQPKLVFRSRHLHPDLSHQVTTYAVDGLRALIDQYPRTAPDIAINGESPGLIVFTSGTTADPKGVVLTQNNLLANISGIRRTIDISADWRLLSVLPLSHMYELTGSLAVLSDGASIYYLSRVTPLAIATALREYRITTLLAIPQLLVLLLERIEHTVAEEHKAWLFNAASKIAGFMPFPMRRLLYGGVHSRLGGHLTLIVTGGAPIPIEVASAWENMGVRIVQGYGLTETSPILTVNGLKKRMLNSPGRPLFNVQLRIADNGEIQAKGPSVFGGYWHNPEATEAAFTADGWFKTGDVGRLKDGWLYIQGRLKFAIVLSSGLKVFPEDVELVASKNSVLDAVCVVGEPQADGESVLAVVTSNKSDEEVDKAIAEVNAHLESFQHIAKWRRWPNGDFPRTRLLKVDRRRVQEWANSSVSEVKTKTSSIVGKRDPLLDVIRLSLGKPNAEIGEADRLSDIGLDSLRRLTLIALTEEYLGISVAEQNVTPTTTISDLRKLLCEGSRTEVSRPLPTWPFKPWVRLVGNGLRETIIRALLRIWVKMDVEGQDNLQDLELPAIFIFNHTDDFDGPVIYQAIPHPIRKKLAVAAADDVLHKHRILALVIRLFYAGFNLSRSEPYMPSLEYISQIMDDGWSVVLSPEGSISTNGELQPFKSGVGLLAVELGVPVVPIKTIGLCGTLPLHAKWPKSHSHVKVRVGQPIKFGNDGSYDEVTEKLHQRMLML